MELIRCEPYSLRLTTVACATQHQLAQRGRPGTAGYRCHCVGCPVGKAHAAGEDSGAEVTSIEVVATPYLGKKARTLAKLAAKPPRTCDQCQNLFAPWRDSQRFCPGGACSKAYHKAKRRKGKARPSKPTDQTRREAK